MTRKTKYSREVEECVEKLESILHEYNCVLWIDKQLDGELVVVDMDTREFQNIDHKSDYKL